MSIVKPSKNSTSEKLEREGEPWTGRASPKSSSFPLKNMEDFRSKSYGHGRMQMESYYGAGPTSYGISGMQDLRCYSATYASSMHPSQNQAQPQPGNDLKLKKGKSTNGSISKSWSFGDPELQRKKRVASYKVYAMEGKVKGSLRKSFRWLKERCTRVVYGW